MYCLISIDYVVEFKGEWAGWVSNDHKVTIYNFDQLLTCIYLQCSAFWIKLKNRVWGWILYLNCESQEINEH